MKRPITAALALVAALCLTSSSLMAMPDADHARLVRSVKKAKFSGDVRELMKITARDNTFSVKQVKELRVGRTSALWPPAELT